MLLLTVMHTTVVIPVYNEQAFIQQCLDSLSHQTVMPDKVLLVDNNCTDDTIAIARTYSFVEIIKESEQGICAATKTGLDAAALNSGIILRCDADSRPSSNWIENVSAQFSNKDIIAVTGPGEFYDLTGIKKWLAHTLYMKAYFKTVGRALGQKPLFGSNFALRASLWQTISDETHLDKQDLHDDMDISYHVAQYGIITYVPTNIMPVSGRPFTSLYSLLKRYPIGMKSVLIHWPKQAPWRIRIS